MDAPVNMTAYEGFYGSDNNYSAIPATMMNGSASSEIDWGAVVTNGIKGAAVNAVNTMIGGAYASGQLQQPQQQSVGVQSSPQTVNLILIGAALWFMLGNGKAAA